MVVTDAARRLAANASIAKGPGRAVFHQSQECHKRLEPAQPARRQRNTPCWIDSGLSTRAKLRSTDDNGKLASRVRHRLVDHSRRSRALCRASNGDGNTAEPPRYPAARLICGSSSIRIQPRRMWICNTRGYVSRRSRCRCAPRRQVKRFEHLDCKGHIVLHSS